MYAVSNYLLTKNAVFKFLLKFIHIIGNYGSSAFPCRCRYHSSISFLFIPSALKSRMSWGGWRLSGRVPSLE